MPVAYNSVTTLVLLQEVPGDRKLHLAKKNWK